MLNDYLVEKLWEFQDRDRSSQRWIPALKRWVALHEIARDADATDSRAAGGRV